MNQKTTYYILFAVIIAAAGVWWTQSGPGPLSAETDKLAKRKPLFDPAPKDIVALEVAPQGKPAMAMVKADGKWRLTAPLNAPAAASFVDPTVTRVRDMAYDSSIGPSDPDRPGAEQTGLDKPTRFKLTDAGGKAYIIKVGSSVPASKQIYVQKEGDDAIYIVPDDGTGVLHRELDEFRDKRVAEFDLADATRIEVAGQEHYALVKQGDAWSFESPVTARADKTAVESLLRSVSNLTVNEFIEDAPKNLAAYGLSQPALSVTIHAVKKTPRPAPATQASQPAAPQFDEKPYTISLALGGKTGDKRFARLGGDKSPSVFQVLDSNAQSIAPALFSLRDKAIVHVDANQARHIKLTTHEGIIELSKKDGGWEISGAGTAGIGSNAAEFAAVDDLLKAVGNLKATGFESREETLNDYGLRTPRASVEITGEGTVKLSVGSATPSGTGVYVGLENDPNVAVVKTEEVAPLLVGPLNFVNRDMLRFERSRVRKIELNRGDTSATLESTDGKWRVAAPMQADADLPAINNLLTDVSTLRARRVVGTQKQLALFGLDKPRIAARITVAPPPPPQPPTTTQAAPPPTPPPGPPQIISLRAAKRDGKVYVYVDGSSNICEVDGRVFENLDAEVLDRRVGRVESSQVTGFSLARAGGAPFTFEKKDDQWTLSGETTFPVDSAKVAALTQAFASLKVDRYAAYQAKNLKQFGLDKPAITLKIRSAGNPERELRIAASGPPNDASGRRYAALGGSNSVFLISRDDVAKFDKDVKGFQRSM